MLFKNKQFIFIILTICVSLALIMPSIVQQGMFMDGIQYAIVSKNLAIGKGTFWLPFLSDSWNRHGINYFLEHPPLVYFLQSYFFKFFGNGYCTEKIYSVFTFIVCAILINKIWLHLFKNEPELIKYSWLPILIWLIIPSVHWAFVNNMHENTVSIFVLGSILFSLKAINNFKLYDVIISGILIFCATLCKGLPGMYPLLFFIIYGFCYENINIKRVITYTFILVAILILTYTFIILLNNEALFSLKFYIQNRLFDRLTNDHLVEYRFSIIFWLFTDLLVPFILVIVLLFIFKLKTFFNSGTIVYKNDILFFILLGLAGVIPLAFTHVQRAVYFMPALPLFAIAISLFLVNGISNLIYKININSKLYINSNYFICILCIGLITYNIFLVGKIERDGIEINEANLISKVVLSDATLIVEPETYTNWALQFYLLRNHNITINCNKGSSNFFLYKKNSLLDSTIKVSKLNLNSTIYSLYKKNN